MQAEIFQNAGLAYDSVNTVMISTYWNIGRRIVEEEQGGADRAAYGKAILKGLANTLTHEYGSGGARMERAHTEPKHLRRVPHKRIAVAVFVLVPLALVTMSGGGDEKSAPFCRSRVAIRWLVVTKMRGLGAESLSNFLFGQFKPWKWLEISGNISWLYYENPLSPLLGKTMKSHNIVSGSLNLTGNFNKFVVSLAAQTGQTMYEGDRFRKIPFTIDGSAGWIHKSLYVGVHWNLNYMSQITGMRSGGFSWTEDMPEYGRHFFGVTLQYTFTKGINRYYKSSKMSTISSENGLLR